MVSERDYETAADRYADQGIRVAPIGPPLAGEEAAAAGRDFLVEEFGSIEAVEAEIRRGRPKIGATRHGASPVVRARISDREFAAFKQLEQITGRTQADLVREGVHLLLEQHKLAS